MNRSSITFHAASEADTQRLGQAIARAVPDGTTIALIGTLGAGKTRLVQAVAAACGIAREEVVSPTFTLCHEYRGARAINHFDAYRLKDDDEFLALGPDEYFDSPALTFVEWGDRVIDCLPRRRMEVHLRVVGETERDFELVSQGMDDVLEALARQWQ